MGVKNSGIERADIKKIDSMTTNKTNLKDPNVVDKTQRVKV